MGFNLPGLTMNKKLLLWGAAGLAGYFLWASRSSAGTAPAMTGTRTPSSTPNGVGFNIADLFQQKPLTVAPDPKASNPAPAPAPAPANPAATPPGFSMVGGAPVKAPPGSGYFGAGGTEINDPTAVGRFNSIKEYVNTLDWNADNKAASAAALASAAGQYGVSQREIAIATGYKDGDIAALLSGHNVARF